MSIAVMLVQQVVEVAKANGLNRVTEAEVEVGAMRQVVPEALELAFGAVAEGTIACGATLVIREIGIEGRCRQCRKKHSMQPGFFLCPECGAADVDIISGNDIVLKSIACEEET